MFSIIIPTFNNIEYLKKCIESIKKNSFYNTHEIIPHVNEGSDGTLDFLKNNSFTLASVLAGAPVLAGDLGNVEAQYVKSYDFGYRVNGKKTALDINIYVTILVEVTFLEPL